jgi:hypothetical protein
MVRISGFHLENPGSTPGVGTVLPLATTMFCLFAVDSDASKVTKQLYKTKVEEQHTYISRIPLLQ